jgi:hypothetical protein
LSKDLELYGEWCPNLRRINAEASNNPCVILASSGGAADLDLPRRRIVIDLAANALLPDYGDLPWADWQKAAKFMGSIRIAGGGACHGCIRFPEVHFRTLQSRQLVPDTRLTFRE